MVEHPGTGCWVWQGKTCRDGYGRWKIGGAYYAAHRVAYASWNEPVHSGVVIRHSCDNPSCINPVHLLAGTVADNMNDRQERGRQASGEKNGRSKLSRQAAHYIRSSGLRQAVLARMYGVDPSTIRDIRNGRIWR